MTDDALRWDGDEPTSDTHPDGASNGLLIALGVLGGMYLLWSIGWGIAASRITARIEHGAALAGYAGTDAPLADPMTIAAGWLAMAGPAAWFVAVLVATRGQAPWVRMVWLVAGVAILVPWPFVMIGAVGV